MFQVTVWAVEQDRQKKLVAEMERAGVSFNVKEEETKFTWSNLDG